MTLPGDNLIIFTDLDGTLLDGRTYSFGRAREALALLTRFGVPLVVCTSKTRAEILYWRERLGNSHPFVSENGGGIFVPSGYFGFEIPGAVRAGGYLVLTLGAPYARLRAALKSIRAEGFDIRGFGDMTPGEVAGLTGLEPEQARLAMQREFDEPFVLGGDAASRSLVQEAVRRRGLDCTSGRLMHIIGGSDKGRAVRHLAGFYERELGAVVTAAIGDSPNDAEMLSSVDHPFLVRNVEGHHNPVITGERITRVDGVGPEGWDQAVRLLVERLGLG